MLGWIFNRGVNVWMSGREGPIIYKEGRKKMIIGSSRVVPDGAIQVNSDDIQKWEPPFDEEITSEKKDEIMGNIRAKFESWGEIVRFR